MNNTKSIGNPAAHGRIKTGVNDGNAAAACAT